MYPQITQIAQIIKKEFRNISESWQCSTSTGPEHSSAQFFLNIKSVESV